MRCLGFKDWFSLALLGPILRQCIYDSSFILYHEFDESPYIFNPLYEFDEI